MRQLIALVALAVALAACALAVRESLARRRSERALAAVEERLARLESAEDAAASAASSIASLVRPSPPPGQARPASVPAFVNPAAVAPPTPAVSEVDLQQLVDRRIEEKLRDRPKEQKGGDRKLPLHDLAKELALDPATQSRVAEVANDIKRQILELARTPRPDGTSLADELMDAMLKGDEKAAKATFAKIFTEKVPGRDQTYLAGVVGLQDKANQGLERLMGPDAFTRFRHMNVKPENIETGYDPWAEYLKQRAAAKK